MEMVGYIRRRILKILLKREINQPCIKHDGETVLSTAKGSYGTLAACDATAAEDEGEEDEGEKTENPNTADTIATYMTIAAVALLGLGATAFVAKKSNR